MRLQISGKRFIGAAILCVRRKQCRTVRSTLSGTLGYRDRASERRRKDRLRRAARPEQTAMRPHRHDLFSITCIHKRKAVGQRCKNGKQLCPHEVRQLQRAVGAADIQRPSGRQPEQMLPGQAVECGNAAVSHMTVHRRGQQHFVQRTRIGLHAESAQRIADETVSKANKEAKQTIASAEEQAKAILASAKAESDAAKAETAEIRKSIEDYRSRFVRLVEEQANVLKTDLALFE